MTNYAIPRAPGPLSTINPFPFGTSRSAPAVWNLLPKTVVNSDSVTMFKSRLKAFPLLPGFLPFSQ